MTEHCVDLGVEQCYALKTGSSAASKFNREYSTVVCPCGLTVPELAGNYLLLVLLYNIARHV